MASGSIEKPVSYYIKIDNISANATKEPTKKKIYPGFFGIDKTGWVYLQIAQLIDPSPLSIPDNTLNIKMTMINIEEKKPDNFVISKPFAGFIDSTEFSDISFRVFEIEDDGVRNAGRTDVCENGNIVYAHKVVLAAASPWFRMLLSNGMSESSQREVSIYGVSLDIFKRLVRYCYTYELELNGLEDEYKCLEAADKFQLITIRENIFYTIRQQINEENVWQIWECADKHKSNKTINACISYINTHMKSVVESDAFLKANADYIQRSFDAEIVHINDDYSMDETKLYEAAVKWAKEREKEIKDKEDDNINKQFETDVATILESIRFSKIPVGYLVKNIEADNFIMNFSGIQKKLTEGFRYHATSGTEYKQEHKPRKALSAYS